MSCGRAVEKSQMFKPTARQPKKHGPELDLAKPKGPRNCRSHRCGFTTPVRGGRWRSSARTAKWRERKMANPANP